MGIFGRILILLVVTLGGALPAAAQTDVNVEVHQFGAGKWVRPGGVTGLRLKLTSNLAEPLSVWVQWQVPNVDGDVGEYGRSLTLTPGQPAYAWLYAPLSPEMSPLAVFTIRVFEERDGERRGELGGTRINLSGSQMASLWDSLILIVGNRRMGLDDYGIQGSSRISRPVGAHENTHIADIEPSHLPDRWEGLMQFEAVGWVGDNVPPQDLGVDQAIALREYVRRGGHLIISLPSAGNQWGLGASDQTQIEDLLPCRTQGVVPRKDDAVPLSALVPVFSKTNDVRTLIGNRRESEYSIRVFKDLRGEFNVIDNHYEPLVVLPDGRVIAIQRRFGFGRISVIGVDLSDGRLVGMGLPQGDAFWNRILGRRCDTPTATELIEINKAEMLANPSGPEKSIGVGPLFTGLINMRGTAAKGLLLAFVLFVAYWLVAGPAGFALLKYYKRTHHSWIAFAGCAALFTAVAWSAVKLVPTRMEVKHVTFLDHIARPPDDTRSGDPQFQRAVSFFSIYLPDYGNTQVSIASDPEQRDLLYSWTPPAEAISQFPNVDRYRVEVARSPANFPLPSRSTSTLLYAHWLGGLSTDWGGLLRVDPNNPIRVVMQGDHEQSLSGSIINELPGTLTNVQLLWVKNNRISRRAYAKQGDKEQLWVAMRDSGKALNTGNLWSLAAPLDPKGAIDLAGISAKTSDLQLNLFRKYIEPYQDSDFTGGATIDPVLDERDRRQYMEMLSLFHALDQPQYMRAGFNDAPSVGLHRELGRELDLSPWFNRPCLIVIGHLLNSSCPIPLRIDGDDQAPVSEGWTVVRWIYPLPLDEKIAFAEVFAEDPEAETP